jgi:membrane-bound metal-dependent hydrolase YbcI (DUF457 family)
MGNFLQHLAAAMATLVVGTLAALFFLLTPHWAIIASFGVGMFLLGSVFPDIDHVGSKIHKGLLLPRVYGRRFKHWGHTHSIAAAIAYGFALNVWSPFLLGWTATAALWLGFSGGFVLHLLVDEACKSPGNKRKAFKLW